VTDFDAVDACPPELVRERVRFIDTIRNAIIHNVRLPRPTEGETRHQLGQRVATIVYRYGNCAFSAAVLQMGRSRRAYLNHLFGVTAYGSIYRI
jgi:hypothetical protein